jgi:two-component sensor histidine kinase
MPATGSVQSIQEAVSIGLIITELVMNALKHAFIRDTVDGRIIVAYEAAEAAWRLEVSDNGCGRTPSIGDELKPGLGKSIVEALGHQLGAQVEISSGPQGTQVLITGGTFARLTDAAHKLRRASAGQIDDRPSRTADLRVARRRHAEWSLTL